MPANQANVEYWFRLLYECFHGGCYGGTIQTTALTNFISHVWLWIIVIGYLLSLAGLFVVIYCTVRLFELRKREEEYYSTLLVAPEKEGGNHRWLHIETLAQSSSPSEWREAIIEADIMLEDILTKEGYTGDGVGEKLKGAGRANFATLNDAWEAHKVRNQIAHEGSAFDLTDSLARRTISRYEAVFREFKVI